MILEFLYIVITLLFSAFFSGMEIAFVSSNKLYIELEKSKGNFQAKIISKFLEKPSEFISTMLVGNNIALVIYGLLMAKILNETLFQSIHESSPFLALLLNTILSTGIVLLTAEFLPKVAFNKNANFLLKFFSVPAIIIYYLLRPLVLIFSLISRLILMILGQKIETEEINFSRKDLESYLQEHTSNISEDEEVDSEIQILQNALEFNTIKARECMTPRTDIIAVSEEEPIETLNALFVENGFSKILVYKDNVDHIRGYAHIYDLFKKPSSIKEITNDIALIPESMPANDILNLFTKERKSIALVIDEFGGTAGLITLEDVVEELIGEIEDEHDQEMILEKQVNENEYLLSARHEIDYLNQEYEWNLPESDEYETLGGLMSILLEKIPEEGETLFVNDIEITAIKVSTNVIEEVHIKIF
ncbi:MAG: hemolysin family protein [Flavobacteriales bacterium]|nr:hemolysin family protein [Flavobacteriales bacterium]